jgi:site-specific recombinase XerD
MLRHGYGYQLVNEGVNTRTTQDYLGHRDLRHTERYTEVDASRFRDLWRRTGSGR